MASGLDAFDRTLEESNLWLKDLMRYLGSTDRERAYRALRATLHALRDRIGADNAVHLAAQLPTLLRGVYYEGWRMHALPTHERHLADFLATVEGEARGALGGDTKAAVRAVFAVLRDRIDPAETQKLIGLFPRELRSLWPGQEPAH